MTIKKAVSRIPVVGEISRIVYSKLKGTWKLDPSFWIPRILSDDEGVAVQIGSNDGKTGDPLHRWLTKKKSWAAVFVEPVPFLFDRLTKTYSGESRFAFEKAVINDGSEVRFFWVSPEAPSALPDLPPWWDQLGGFNREHIINHIPELEPFIESTVLPGMSLMDLFERHRLDRIDLLHIDTEGADYEILSQLDLDRFCPRVILYEQIHLSDGKKKQSIRFLQDSYLLFNLGVDVLGISKEANISVQKILQRLRSAKVPEY